MAGRGGGGLFINKLIKIFNKLYAIDIVNQF